VGCNALHSTTDRAGSGIALTFDAKTRARVLRERAHHSASEFRPSPPYQRQRRRQKRR
jgi:hypothetical protein